MEKAAGKQVAAWSAPPKVNPCEKSQSNFMRDAQKAYHNSRDDEDGEKVHIPETLEDSDSDSDSFTQRVQQLTGGGASGQGQSSNQFWFVEAADNGNVIQNIINEKAASPKDCVKTCVDQTGGTPSSEAPPVITVSLEVFITEDNIVNTQGSVEVDADDSVVKDVQDVEELGLLKSKENEVMAQCNTPGVTTSLSTKIKA
jgi:hypothetical protein